MYDLGIIGGMGPLATASIYSRIIYKTKANSDQEHMSIVILNKPSIPDRSEAILKGGLSPVNDLNECIKELVNLKVKNFIIACNTAHFFADELKIDKSINFINMIDEVLVYVKREYKGLPVVILGTNGTIQSDIYKKNYHARDLKVIYPDDNLQDTIMNYIYDIKAGFNKQSYLKQISEGLKDIERVHKNCVFIIACTELSLISKHINEGLQIIDAVDVLVDVVIQKCGYQGK